MDNDKVQRVIGIDFGTSTSLIRSKRYQNDQPIGDSYSVSAITYGNGAGDSKAVTLVRHNADDTFTCGRYGEEKLEGSTVYREFKMNLEDPDLRKQNLAKELTGEYFKYLYDRYDHQKSDLGQITDDVRTIISYPAKWKRETRDFMEAVAANAGFPNVSSMDEPSAALYAVLCRKKDELSQQGLLKRGQSGYMLLVDMGAGTTDLAVCRYQFSDTDSTVVSADGIKTEIISTWPDHSSDLTFGGREVDRILEDYLIEYLKSCGFNNQMSERAVRGVSGVKAWKEDTVSLLLTQNQPVNTCSTISQFVMFAPQPLPFPAFDREKFQQMLGSKLDEFKKLVLDCLSVAVNQEPELFAKGIDLVVLTGGHSSWYFTSELLDGTMPGIDHPVLEKVQREKNRVLRLTNPQETVALGMVYSQLPFHIEKKEDAPDIEPSDPEDEGEDDKAGENISVRNFIMGYRFPSITPLYEALVPQLMQNLNVPNQAKVYRAFDATIFGSCKNGTIFTDAGIYCRTILGSPSFCSWNELAEGLLRFSSGTVYIHNQNSHIEKEAGFFTTMDEDIKSFYRQLKRHAKAEFCREDSSGEPETLDYSTVDYEKILSRVLRNFNAGTVSMIAGGKTPPATIRVQFRIPPEETIYLAHDDTRLTWIHVAAAGSALTGNGVYSKSDDGIIVFVSWQEFAVGTLEPNGNDILLVLPDGTRKLAGRFALCRPQAIALYLELQKAFRAAAEDPERTAPQCLTPVETFLQIYDWSGMNDILSPANGAVLRKEAEPFIGEIYVAYRNFVVDQGTTYWFWFAIGEKGIYTSHKTMITWEEFCSGNLLFHMQKQAFPVEKCLDGIFVPSAYPHCCLNDIIIPTSDSFANLWIGAFFLELKKYLNNPAGYTTKQYRWTKDNQQDLYAFLQTHPSAGMLKPYTGDPNLREFLKCPPSSQTIYQTNTGNLKSVFAWAGCMDEKGFRRRRNKGGQVTFTPHSAFLSHPLWVAAGSAESHFFAGTHYLFGSSGKMHEAEQTYQYLKELQQYLRDRQ